jgi:NADPH-dependent 2,4-dienoyl-CoA reductase/sulfur reductase-like enzyme
MRHTLLATFAILVTSSFAIAQPAPNTFDVVVYGGTAGGVMAAVSAARQGLKTALVEPTGHLGGMVSGGLSWTDYGKKEVIGGFALEFYWRAGVHYQMGRYGNEVSWLHEPHVAEDIFREMLAAAGVSVFDRLRLRERNGVRKSGTTVEAITTEDGTEFTASVFIATFLRSRLEPIRLRDSHDRRGTRRECEGSRSHGRTQRVGRCRQTRPPHAGRTHGRQEQDCEAHCDEAHARQTHDHEAQDCVATATHAPFRNAGLRTTLACPAASARSPTSRCKQ